MPITADILVPFKRRVFVETGTYQGLGIEAALEAGFERIESIELVPAFAIQAKMKFITKPAVTVHQGDSRHSLHWVLQKFAEPVTIWLDAHGFWSDDAAALTSDDSPLLQEIEQIALHRNDNTILVDDLRLLGKEIKPDLDTVKAAVLKINPDYKFRTIAGEVPDDILVCEVQNGSRDLHGMQA